MIPVNNYVLVEPIVKTDEIQYKSLNLKLDRRFDRSSYQPTVCRVVSVCKNLIYNPTKIKKANVVIDDVTRKPVVETSWEPQYENTMPWKTRKEIKCGDIVWVNYYPIVRAEDEQDDSVIIQNADMKCYLIHYSDIYCAKRADKIIMLNGYIMIEPVLPETNQREENLKKLGLWIPEQKKEETPDKYGIVRHIGYPCDEYEDGELCGEDDDFIQVGDTVRLSMQFNRRLEQSPLFRWFDGKEYIISRRRNLLAVVYPE